MGLERKNSILVQKYKIAFEEHEEVKATFESGMRDLNAHLDILKKRLSEKIKNQKERFDKNFFSGPEDVQLEKESEEEALTSKEKPKWAKKAFREIVLSTHPDKISFIPVESVRDKFLKYYNLAVESYNDDSFENLIFISADLGIEIQDDIVQEAIIPKLNHLLEEIERIKNTIAYDWANIENDKKLALLERYLNNLGYVFDSEEVEEAIEQVKRIKRKTGTKPVNYIKRRIKS